MSHPLIERNAISMHGFIAIAIALLLLGLGVSWLPGLSRLPDLSPAALIPGAACLLLALFILMGLYVVQPNHAAVLQFFGAYSGSDHHAGLRWANPFCSKLHISLRTQNFISDTLKVNDKLGNPIEIAAAVVWKVSDTAQATFGVEQYESFVRIQSESAIRHLASQYAYDRAEDDNATGLTLRENGERIGLQLQNTLQLRLAEAGVVIQDTKITHLAYAPEIAGAMLRRQQANAVLAARKIIVEGAVSMVEMALHSMSERQIVELDDERRAAMVSNLMVVLCGEKEVSPVINSGTLYT